jgi:hypothetical protein
MRKYSTIFAISSSGKRIPMGSQRETWGQAIKRLVKDWGPLASLIISLVALAVSIGRSV